MARKVVGYEVISDHDFTTLVQKVKDYMHANPGFEPIGGVTYVVPVLPSNPNPVWQAMVKYDD